VFEIGSSLRQARVRRRLELDRVEADTHIRSRYLKALEDERFDLLPEPAYARGFLRTYADYLGLDAQHFVDEYNARFIVTEEMPVVPARIARPRPIGRYANVVVGALVVLLGVVAWQIEGDGEQTGVATTVPPAETVPKAAPKKPAPVVKRPVPQAARLVVTAAHGPCWLEVRIGSSAGRRLFLGVLSPGRSLRFTRQRLWIRLGAPWNLRATVNGRVVHLPEDTTNVLVTARGARVEGV
jgi:cytoskeleton protein RodZ